MPARHLAPRPKTPTDPVRRRSRTLWRLVRRPAAVLVCGALPVLGAAAPADAALRSFSSIALTADGQGYLITSDRGENYAFGSTAPQPNPSGFSGRIVDVATTADGKGALALSSTGQFYAYGTQRAFPNPTGFSGEMVAVAVTANGQGAVAMSSTGQFYAYGQAHAQPNPRGFSGRMVDVAMTADGSGLLAVSSAGQFYAYGSASAQRNPSGFSGEIRAVDLTADGRGALAVSSAGQYYAYGTAHAEPNPSGFTGGIVDVDMTADGRGAVAVSGSGQVYASGTAVYRGNADPGTPDGPASPSGRRLSAQGVAFLEQYEGFSSVVYPDQAGHCTIGYGHLVHTGGCTDADRRTWGSISRATASQLFAKDSDKFADVVRRALPRTPLTQAQFDALVSFTYNVGAGGFGSSSALRDLTASPPAYGSVPGHLRLWNKIVVGGRQVVSCGLDNRRIAEGRLFSTGAYTGPAKRC